MLEARRYDNGAETWAGTPTQWANGYNICVFKVTPGPIGGLQSKHHNGDILREILLSSQLPSNVTLLLLSEEPATVKIDQFKPVLLYDSTRSDTDYLV